MESADTHLLLAMMMTMLRFYQAMTPISPLILRGLNCRRILIHQEPLIVLPRLRMFLLGESAREDQKHLVVRIRDAGKPRTTRLMVAQRLFILIIVYYGHGLRP